MTLRSAECSLPGAVGMHFSQEEFFTTVQVAGRAGDGRLDPAVVDCVSWMRGISSGGKGAGGGPLKG